MKERLLKKDKVKDLCISASAEWETHLPLENFAGDTHFVKLDVKKKKSLLERLNLDYESMVIPPKSIAFPQLEPLFEFKQQEISETIKPSAKRLLFGLRACDAKAILFMDDFFRRNFQDIYYLNRSTDKLLVIVGCKRPLESCFCTSTKSGPFLPLADDPQRGKYTDFDLQLIDLGEQYAVEVGSKKGEEFVNSFQEFFALAEEKDIELKKEAKRDAQKAVSLRLDFNNAIKKFCEDKVPKQIYERIAERCIYCGGCLYVCPTCTCFNVFDEQNEEIGKRYRNWDACVFAGYTREASGHNPRPEKFKRTSRRYEHKLKYDYLATGMSGCVGCGRCLLSCPVNIGISQVIQEL